MNASPTDHTASRPWLRTALLLTYVVAVHAADTFRPLWTGHRWRLNNGFDVFHFLAWLAVPLAFTYGRMDWGYFGFKRWRRSDGLVLAGLVVAGALCVLAVRWLPSLRTVYPSLGHLSPSGKRQYLCYMMTWNLSWLIGWEFLHRYVLLCQMKAQWPRYGWLAVPIIEGVYHLQKPLPEALLMTLFSLLATGWTLRRRNVLLPFLAHLAVEIELLAFMLLV